MKIHPFAVLCLLVVPAAAQLTTEQRLADFHNLTDLYARRYAALEWKKAAVGFDALNLTPWLDRVRTAKTDLEFYDVMIDYVASLKDAHDQYLVPSEFEAWLGFSVDLYDGKALIDSVDRTILNFRVYPFGPGDELISVDGKTPDEWIQLFSKYVSAGSSRATQRMAAELITDRYQGYYPFAGDVGETAVVVIQRRNGERETYNMPWFKDGTPLTVLGASPSPTAQVLKARSAGPHYLDVLHRYRNFKLPVRTHVVGFDRLAPVFALPVGFEQRLGKRSYDSYYSGTYTTDDGTRVGYLRIPDFEYPSLTDLDKEMKNFEANTDVLVVDVMRNPGGDVCAAEDILSRLSVRDFQGAVAETRVTWMDIIDLDYAIEEAEYFEDTDSLTQLTAMRDAYREGYDKNQGRTRPMPICAVDATRTAAATAYTKPVLVLVDEMSASSADIFAAMVQDNQVGPLFGSRTMGAGGSPEQDFAGVYSEGTTTLTRSLVVRPRPVTTPEFPTTSYVENVGVRPEIAADYMTADNLLNQGQSFVKAFTDAAVQLVYVPMVNVLGWR